MAETQSQSVFLPAIPPHLLTREDIEFLSAFHIETVTLENGHIRLFAIEWCTEGHDTEGDYTEDQLFARLQEIIRRSKGELTVITKETCYFSEQAVPGEDEVGGSAVVITADAVFYEGTGPWRENKVDELTSSKAAKSNFLLVVERDSREESTFATIEALVVGFEPEEARFLQNLKEALAHWMRSTPEGKAAWERSCEDFNIGDLAGEDFSEGSVLGSILAAHGITNLDITISSQHKAHGWTYDTVLIGTDH